MKFLLTGHSFHYSLHQKKSISKDNKIFYFQLNESKDRSHDESITSTDISTVESPEPTPDRRSKAQM